MSTLYNAPSHLCPLQTPIWFPGFQTFLTQMSLILLDDLHRSFPQIHLPKAHDAADVNPSVLLKKMNDEKNVNLIVPHCGNACLM